MRHSEFQCDIAHAGHKSSETTSAFRADGRPSTAVLLGAYYSARGNFRDSVALLKRTSSRDIAGLRVGQQEHVDEDRPRSSSSCGTDGRKSAAGGAPQPSGLVRGGHVTSVSTSVRSSVLRPSIYKTHRLERDGTVREEYEVGGLETIADVDDEDESEVEPPTTHSSSAMLAGARRGSLRTTRTAGAAPRGGAWTKRFDDDAFFTQKIKPNPLTSDSDPALNYFLRKEAKKSREKARVALDERARNKLHTDQQLDAEAEDGVTAVAIGVVEHAASVARRAASTVGGRVGKLQANSVVVMNKEVVLSKRRHTKAAGDSSESDDEELREFLMNNLGEERLMDWWERARQKSEFAEDHARDEGDLDQHDEQTAVDKRETEEDIVVDKRETEDVGFDEPPAVEVDKRETDGYEKNSPVQYQVVVEEKQDETLKPLRTRNPLSPGRPTSARLEGLNITNPDLINKDQTTRVLRFLDGTQEATKDVNAFLKKVHNEEYHPVRLGDLDKEVIHDDDEGIIRVPKKFIQSPATEERRRPSLLELSPRTPFEAVDKKTDARISAFGGFVSSAATRPSTVPCKTGVSSGSIVMGLSPLSGKGGEHRVTSRGPLSPTRKSRSPSPNFSGHADRSGPFSHDPRPHTSPAVGEQEDSFPRTLRPLSRGFKSPASVGSPRFNQFNQPEILYNQLLPFSPCAVGQGQARTTTSTSRPMSRAGGGPSSSRPTSKSEAMRYGANYAFLLPKMESEMSLAAESERNKRIRDKKDQLFSARNNAGQAGQRRRQGQRGRGSDFSDFRRSCKTLEDQRWFHQQTEEMKHQSSRTRMVKRLLFSLT